MSKVVENGELFEKGEIVVDSKIKTLEIPKERMKIVQELKGHKAKEGSILVFVKKTQHFRGHPPGNIRIGVESQKRLKVATKIEKNKLLIGYGCEFFTPDGISTLSTVLLVDKKYKIKKNKKLTGSRKGRSMNSSIVSDEDSENYDNDEGGGYWYGGRVIKKDWSEVKLSTLAENIPKFE